MSDLPEYITDGFGNEWLKCGPDCDMEVVRPGKVQCSCSETREQRDRMIEERDLEWFQIIESFANFHPVSMQDALEQGIKRCKAQKEKLNNVKQQRDRLADFARYVAERSDSTRLRRLAKQTLAAVEGGDHDQHRN